MPVVEGALPATSSISSAAWDGEGPGVLIVCSPVRCLRQECWSPTEAGVGGWGAKNKGAEDPIASRGKASGRKGCFS